MDCPVCRNPMIVLELDQVEVDYCTDCAGIWLDAGELELLLGDAAAAHRVMDAFSAAETSETPRRCPICRRKMQKVQVGEADGKPELIDRCKKEHGLWFDRGELQAVLTLAHFDDEGRVKHLLGDLFCTDKKP